MAALVQKAGAALQTGATASPVTGTHTQSDTRSAGGDLRIIRDETGADLSAYAADPHEELSFEAVLAAGAADKAIGDVVTVQDRNYLVTEWRVTESNDDVKKVTIGLRSTTLSAPAAAGSNT